jgi:hypothetical protein
LNTPFPEKMPSNLGECEGEPISAFPRVSGDRAWVVDDLRGKIGNPNDID